MDNKFKDHPVYGEYFAVSEDGQVFSKRTNRILKLYLNDNGYLVFATRLGGRKGICKRFIVHRLVAETYVENLENKPFVNHKDGVKTNNHTSNLEWVTSAENARHARRLGLIDANKISGSSNHASKLTDQQVLEIRRNNTDSNREIAALYGVGRHVVGRIRRGESYKNA